MLFTYKVVTKEGQEATGSIDAQNQDVAVSALQKNGFAVVSIVSDEKKSLLNTEFSLFKRVSSKEISIFSRQIATLLEANVPALRTFRMLAAESENPTIVKTFTEVSDDIQNGVAISDALARHPDIFSDFYINMVRSGEESGKLSQTFLDLADYLERSYELMSKARGALIYPAFVLVVFFVVMVLMLVLVVPKLSDMILQGGIDIPLYTKVVLAISSLLINYGLYVLVGVIVAGVFVWNYMKGTPMLDAIKIKIPGVGALYRMIYLSRIADNMHTMLSNGISMVRGLEITAKIVDNDVYRDILTEAGTAVKGGAPLSVALGAYPEIPSIMIQMIKVGEETGEVGNILDKLSIFYHREVETAIETVVSLIEPVMIVALGIGVGGVLASVLMPIYQIAGSM